MALWRPRVRAPSGPHPFFTINQSGTAESSFVSERKRIFLFTIYDLRTCPELGEELAIWGMETIFVETEFGKVHGKAAGNRSDPLVLGLHGWSQRNGWHTWEPLLPPLADAGFYVVSVDMPGWGQSVPAKPEPLTNGRYLDAVLSILDALTPDPATLMGKSWGGGLAINLALTSPQRVRKLILTAPAFRELERLAQLIQPALLAWAEDDPVISFSYAAQFAAAIPNCQLVTYPTGGHSAAQKNAADFAPQAIEFLT